MKTTVAQQSAIIRLRHAINEVGMRFDFSTDIQVVKQSDQVDEGYVSSSNHASFFDVKGDDDQMYRLSIPYAPNKILETSEKVQKDYIQSELRSFFAKAINRTEQPSKNNATTSKSATHDSYAIIASILHAIETSMDDRNIVGDILKGQGYNTATIKKGRDTLIAKATHIRNELLKADFLCEIDGHYLLTDKGEQHVAKYLPKMKKVS